MRDKGMEALWKSLTKEAIDNSLNKPGETRGSLPMKTWEEKTVNETFYHVKVTFNGVSALFCRGKRELAQQDAHAWLKEREDELHNRKH